MVIPFAVLIIGTWWTKTNTFKNCNSCMECRVDIPTQHQQQQRVPLLLGKSTVGCSISAAERRRTKVVLCVDNVTPTCTVEDMSSFITGLSVQVVSCFEAKTRRRRNDRPAVGTVSRKAFL